MNYLRSISIKNFRGFNDVQIHGFQKINLFIGQNNSGKSSILESIFLLAGMSNPILPDNINRIRGLKINNAADYKYLFYKLKFSNTPLFVGEFFDSSVRSLQLNPKYKSAASSANSNEQNNRDIIASDTSLAFAQVSGLELEFSLSSPQNTANNIFKGTIDLDAMQIIPVVDHKYKEELHAVYISGSVNEMNVLARYSEIVKSKKSDVVLSALRKIDPKIESIHPLPDGIFFGYNDIDELVPCNIAGDGVRRFLNIVTSIVEKRDSIVLIDEIENGLHFSAHRLLWESIITISNEFNVQLFISTHNIETLTYLKAILEEDDYKKYQNSTAVFTVLHTKAAGIKSYKYSFDGFKDAIETQTEIR